MREEKQTRDTQHGTRTICITIGFGLLIVEILETGERKREREIEREHKKKREKH